MAEQLLNGSGSAGNDELYVQARNSASNLCDTSTALHYLADQLENEDQHGIAVLIRALIPNVDTGCDVLEDCERKLRNLSGSPASGSLNTFQGVQ